MMEESTPMMALGIAVFGIYYMIVALFLFFLIPRRKDEDSILNSLIDSVILIISLIPATWLFLKTFNLL